MAGFGDLPYAQQLRDVIRELAAGEIRRLRPGAQYATVDTIDAANGKVNVIFPGDTDSVPVSMYSIRPTTGGGVNAGDVVRVEGITRKYVTEVVSGIRSFVTGRLTVSAIQTTASAANMFIDTTTGVVYRSTSSRKYKKDVENIGIPDIRKLRSVTFRSKMDNEKYIGLIAEEIAELDDTILRQLVVYDADGNPDAVQYDRLAVLLLPVLQQLLDRVAVLESHRA